jgi:hypothetical protein
MQPRAQRVHPAKRANQSNEPHLSLFKAWQRIRGPFCVPQGLAGHACNRHWETIDGGLAGCRLCGSMHRCFSGYCPSIMSNEGFVCAVTGVCLGQLFLSEMAQPGMNEYELDARLRHDFDSYHRVHEQRKPKRPRSTAAQTRADDARSTVRGRRDVVRDRRLHCTNTDAAVIVLQRVVCSDSAERCLSYDHQKLQQALRAILVQQLRACRRRQTRVGGVCTINWVDMEAALHSTLSWQRLPARSTDLATKEKVLHVAAHHIAVLVNFMAQHCEPIPTCLRQHDFLIGLLYQMRVGVIVHDVVVLPKLVLLAYILPAEQHLNSTFGVRAKAISEAENVVKHNLRKLPCTLLASLSAVVLP